MPGPIVPSPAPTPSAMALMAFACGSTGGAAAMTLSVLDMGPSLVSLGGRPAEVDRSESGEDERLQAGHDADLEEEEGNGNDRRERADVGGAEEHHHPAAHEQDQQVAGEHVGEESDRQRDDPDEVRDD